MSVLSIFLIFSGHPAMPWPLIKIPFELLVWSRLPHDWHSFQHFDPCYHLFHCPCNQEMLWSLGSELESVEIIWVAEMIYERIQWMSGRTGPGYHRWFTSHHSATVPGVPASSSAQSSASGRSALTASQLKRRDQELSLPVLVSLENHLNKSVFLVTIYKSFSLLRSAILQWISLSSPCQTCPHWNQNRSFVKQSFSRNRKHVQPKQPLTTPMRLKQSIFQGSRRI